MKIYFLFILAGVFLACNAQKASLSMEKDAGKKTISADSLETLWVYAREHQPISTFRTEKILLKNGEYALIATSDNEKTKKIISQYPEIEPYDFITGLAGVEGRIGMYNGIYGLNRKIKIAKTWITKQEIDKLFTLCDSVVVSPDIYAFSIDHSFPPPEMFDRIFNNPDRKRDYIRMPLAINAMCMINGALVGYYPWSDHKNKATLKQMVDSAYKGQ